MKSILSAVKCVKRGNWGLACLLALALAAGGARPAQAVQFVIDYSADAAGEGFNDATIGTARRNAFEAAVSNWSMRLGGTMPVKVRARFEPMGGSANSAMLGTGGPIQVRDFVGAPQAGVFYPAALANQLSGTDVNPSGAAINIQFNSDVDGSVVFGNTGFYYGTDGNAGNDLDFYSVALHEMGHGLGFVDGLESTGAFFGGFPSIYSTLLATGSSAGSTRFSALSLAARQSAMRTALFSVGPKTVLAGGGAGATIFTPDPYQGGSSVGHLDEEIYSPPPNGSAGTKTNELMTPVASVPVHDAGPITEAILQDMGWTRLAADLDLMVSPDTVGETAGAGAATGTLTRNQGITATLVVALSSSNTGKATVPATVTLPSNVASISFPIAAVDNLLLDGPTTVTITAAANGFPNSTANLTVTDNEVAGGPTITSFAPTQGLPGTVVTITGSGFSAVNAVSFNGVAATFTVGSNTSITATVPSTAATGKISVTRPSGTTATTANFTVLEPPVITSFSPASGAIGSQVTLTGLRFTGTSAVRFNGIAATAFTVNSSTQITATVPAGATSGPISITTALTPTVNADATSATHYQVVAAPAITGFTPASGEVGTLITISGTALAGATSVKVNGVAAPFNVVSATTITATVPAGASSGKISVTTPGGTATSTASFTLLTAPVITSFSPASAKAGALVTITGIRFTGATAVTFNGIAATSFTVQSATTISAVVPSGSASGKIAVTTPQGSATSASDFTLLLPPAIASFTPTSAKVGATIIINGANFSDATAVRFNGVLAPGFSVNTAGTRITVPVPSAATSGKLSVTTPVGTATSSANFTLVVTVTINSFTPTSAKVGATVTINGANLSGATAVRFNGVLAPGFTVNAAGTAITVAVPSAAASGKISVTTPAETATSTADFTVLATAAISSFTPTSAKVGTTVIINGTNFSGATAVRFNGVPAPGFTVNTAGTRITVPVPAAATSGKLSVITPAGTATSSASFMVLATVTIGSFTPTSAKVGATVIINGTNFSGATAVRFNGVPAPGFTVNTAGTRITVAVPTGATSGQISVVTPAGTATSSASFTLLVSPTLTSFTPASARVGATVTINGTNLSGATAVRFNGALAPGFTVNTAGTRITVTVPSAATSGQLSVTTPVGTATSSAAFTVLLPPTIATFSPISGVWGTEVTITGKNLTGATLVRFNNKNSTAVTVVSDTQIKAIVPTGTATGPIAVTTSVGASADTGKFQVLAPPSITTFSPASGKVGATITINGSNFTGLLELKFFDNKQPGIVSVTDTQIVATVPAGAATGPLFVRTRIGSMTTKGNFFVLPGAAPRQSGNTLSAAAASAATASVALTFGSALDAAAATDAGRYVVTVNGAVAEIESVAYNAARRTVTLGLAAGALRAGDRVVVEWTGLLDGQGAVGSGQTPLLTVP